MLWWCERWALDLKQPWSLVFATDPHAVLPLPPCPTDWESLEVPLSGGLPGAEPAHSAADPQDIARIVPLEPLVPLDSVLHGNTPAPNLFWGYNRSLVDSSGTARPYLARMNGHPPFPMQQGSPLQHYPIVYSIRSNRQLPREQRGMARPPLNK